MTIVVYTNSYVSVADADVYLNDVSPDWATLTLAVKERLLVGATRFLDNSPWIGSSVTDLQPLAWPREDLSYLDEKLGRIVTVTSGTLPRPVFVAVCNQALYLYAYPSLLELRSTQEFEQIKIGPIELTDSDSNLLRTIPTVPIAAVRSHLRPFLTTRSANTYWRAW